MGTLRFRFALTISAAALFAGCGGSQPPIGAPNALPQSRAIIMRAERSAAWNPLGASPSWMRRGARHENLLYVAGGGGIRVFTYPQGKIEGALSGVGGATEGECVDHLGNVFVTDHGLYSRLDEFAHGRVGKIAELQTHHVAPISCAIDPTTGNLAATGFSDKVNVFAHAQGEPRVFTASKSYSLSFCTYDSDGNLFVVGYNENDYVPILIELPARGHNLIDIKFDTPIRKRTELGGLEWDGKYLAVGVYKRYSGAKIYRFAVNGNRARSVGTVQLGSPAEEIFQFDVVRGFVVIPNVYLVSSELRGNVLFYKYPEGGKPTEVLIKHIGDGPRGAVVSPAQ